MRYEVCLTKELRERILKYDIDNTEKTYDTMMYYIENSEIDVIYDILASADDDILISEIGLSKDLINIIVNYDFDVKFTNKNKYYIKEINN